MGDHDPKRRLRRYAGTLVFGLMAGLLPTLPVLAFSGHDGTALLRMCQGAGKVKALGMMCHSYLNGYMDAMHYGEKKPFFCLGPGDKERLPSVLVDWLKAHPGEHALPAPAVLKTVLAQSFPCRGK